MSGNEMDEITREFRQLGQAATAAIAQWQARNPGKTKVPRKVRKQAMEQLREAMRAHERMLADERRFQRAAVERMIANHRAMSLDLHRSAPGTPEQYARAQWAHAQQRHTLAEQIHSAGHLTREERGQAVMALVSAHYADNPNVRQRPVWGPKPYGMTALKARLAERVSRVREGLEQRLEHRPARKAPQRPGAPSVARLHQYWSNPMPPQDQAANARIAELEKQLRDLAAERDLERRVIAERDQLQAKVKDLDQRYVNSQHQVKRLTEDVAERGWELLDVHTQLETMRIERDEAVRKVAAMTPPADRLGSPERQAAEARAKTPAAPKTPTKAQQTPEQARKSPALGAAPKIDDGDYRQLSPEELKRLLQVKLEAQSKSLKALDEQMQRMGVPEELRERVLGGFEVQVPDELRVDATPGAPEVAKVATRPEAPEAPGAETGPAAPTGGRKRPSRTAEAVNRAAKAHGVKTPEMAGAPNGQARTYNGSRKAAAMSAPEVPLPPEPPSGLEPPEFDR
ncbi:hypothetical protein [Nocardia asiatica]|uniref:hypothetical protein n=1 Tax=Nocardia asiatica TaxID=209252 RepID=UPI002454EF01|nr:hypothetical protein [Nocardia asiatica]